MERRTESGPRCDRHLAGFDLRRRPHLESDVLVIGAGLAGCSAALQAARSGAEVLLLAKQRLGESNTRYAQGGIAALLPLGVREAGDDLDQHVNDTLVAAAGLGDAFATRDILAEGAEAIAFLQAQGCRFDAEGDGRPALTREGGHAHRRILHADGDATGAELSRALIAAVQADPRITVLEGAFAIDLIGGRDRIHGCLYHRRDEVFAALAGATILASGGSGQLYRETTNPNGASGDGLAMAYRAGAELTDLEFVQFHPTTLYIAGGARLLITEAMRGEGALLKNQDGEQFMPKYHPDAELAPRDVVSRAILAEMRRREASHVWLDATHLGADFLARRFPGIHRFCATLDIDISRDWIPVHPSAHYHCGGIRTDTRGRTTLPGLFAVGECACTGLHGANRLASNSLLEAVILGRRAGQDAAAAGGPPGRLRLVQAHIPVATELDIPDLMRSLQALMWRHVGLERSGSNLAMVRRSTTFWIRHQARGFFPDPRGWTLQNLLLAANLVATAAERRVGSVGTHHRSDSTGPVDPAHLGLVRPE